MASAKMSRLSAMKYEQRLGVAKTARSVGSEMKNDRNNQPGEKRRKSHNVSSGVSMAA